MEAEALSGCVRSLLRSATTGLKKQKIGRRRHSAARELTYLDFRKGEANSPRAEDNHSLKYAV
jgi:hypothetical protein